MAGTDIDDTDADRRGFIRAAGMLALAAATAGAVGCGTGKSAGKGSSDKESSDKKDSGEDSGDEAEVTPGEDLMQEHGVLERVLLVYDEAARRLDGGETVDLRVVAGGAGIIQRFVEEYHERQEEDFVFPRLEAARREVDLVAVLRRQHQRGREVTAEILGLAGGNGDKARLAGLLRAFQRMYRPHAAREDTVLFPAFRSVVGGAAYRELGEQFEDREHERFGAHGFEDAVAEVARLEAALGIADLSKFTP
jgi:hemerythrin-like domain-containing protein